MTSAFGEYLLDALPGAKLERTDVDRALFTDRSDGVARQALIMVNRPDRSGDPAWYLESWARCDWSEFPPARTRKLGITIWTDTYGKPAPTYASGVKESLVGHFFAEQDRARVRLPHDAVDTGFRSGDSTLWLSADGQRALLGQPDRRFVAMLPRMTQPLLCS